MFSITTDFVLVLSYTGVVLLDDVDFAAALECTSSQAVPAKKRVKKSSGGCNINDHFFILVMREFYQSALCGL